MIYDIQKASILKRFSAFLLDIILLLVLGAGFAFLLAWITNFDSHIEELQGYYDQCEEMFGVDLSLTQEEIDELSEAEQQAYKNAYDWLNGNSDARKALNLSVALPILIISISLLLSCLVFEFVIPLCLKNGQTVGKKVFSLGVVFTNSVRITNFALFVRAIFGKYTIETMFPVLLIMMFFLGVMQGLIAPILVVALLIFQIVLLIATKTNSLIHDVLANTVVVDMSSQMIFDTTESLVSYKEELSREQAEKKEY